MAIVVMQELNIDISAHSPKRLDDLLDTSFDVIIALSTEAHEAALHRVRNEAAEIVFWPTSDPSMVEGNRDVRLTAYRGVRDTLQSLIDDLFEDQDDKA